MKIKRLHLKNFMSYDDVDVRFPDRGIVLVTGRNGEGKSALIEAVDVAKYNKTLRGTPWWRPGEAGEVILEGDNLKITRRRSPKGTASLSWEGGDNFDTNSKAQAELEKFIEPRDIWRRSSVFSSKIALSFAAATDGDRKKLLESILGLDRFEVAKKACSKDLANLKAKTKETEARLLNVQTSLQYEKKRLKDAERRLETIEVPDECYEVDLEKLQKELDDNRSKKEKLQRVLTAQDTVGREYEIKARSIERQLANLRDKNCPTCSQEIPESLVNSLEMEAKRLRDSAESEKELLAEESEGVRQEMKEIQIRTEKLQHDIGAIEYKYRFYEKAKREIEILNSSKAEASVAVKKFLAEASDLKKSLGEQSTELEVLKACDKVLGLKGVRSVLLSDLLEGLEMSANAWLETFGAKQRIELRPYSEKKTGGTTDSIAILVHGAGGGFGYQAASSGQQRRIDVALVLGLAEMAQASYGAQGSTTFFDEVFDSLDEEGTEGIISALEELAKNRAVVIISHSQALTERLSPDMHLEVLDGEVIQK